MKRTTALFLLDGAVKHLHAIGHPIVNEKGDLVEFVGTVMDVTAAKASGGEDPAKRKRASTDPGVGAAARLCVRA